MRAAWVIALAALVACSKDKASPNAEPAGDRCKDPFVAFEEDRADGPEPEVAPPRKVDLPAMPAFELPPPYPDGARTVREIVVAGKQLVGQEIAVHGFVTSIGFGVWLADKPTDRDPHWIVVHDVPDDAKLTLGAEVTVTGELGDARILTYVSSR